MATTVYSYYIIAVHWKCMFLYYPLGEMKFGLYIKYRLDLTRLLANPCASWGKHDFGLWNKENLFLHTSWKYVRA